MNHYEIKRKAREMISGHLWELITPYVIVSIITLLIHLAMNQMFPLKGEYASWSFLVDILVFPLVLGTYAYVLNFVRQEPYSLKSVFSYYNIFVLAVALYLLQMIFTIAWALLLIIPGIIAALSYTMAPYIMIDGEENPMDCIKKSKKMMNGYKWDYFVFLLSFLGWALLGVITLGLAFIYVIPYVIVSETLYYEELKKITKFD